MFNKTKAISSSIKKLLYFFIAHILLENGQMDYVDASKIVVNVHLRSFALHATLVCCLAEQMSIAVAVCSVD
jgi:hypothetical protein